MTKVVVSVLLIVVLVALLASGASPAIRFAKIHYDSPGADNGSNRSLNGEWFTITNTGGKARSLKNWKVHDKSGHLYRFGTFTLGAHKTVKVHTGRGSDSGLRRYWDMHGYVWGNAADTATLKSAGGRVVDRCSYNAPSKSEKVCRAASRSADLLPDQAMTSLRGFHVDTTEMPGHTLLRFTAESVNIGAGPLELRGSRPNTSMPTMSVRQRIRQQGGGFRSRSVPSFMFWAGDGHNHWHVSDFVSTVLESDTGSNVSVGAKQGFCLTDSHGFDLSLPGAPASKVYKGCVMGGQTSLAVKMGISVGWGDRYGYTFPLQWVDITGLAPGQYRLTATVDEQNYYRESNESNNTTWVILQLNANDTVTVIQQGPHA
jgi:hypothetical protein